MSINKAQAKALANGFLDNLGSSKDELVPRETLSVLFELAGEFIEECQENLNQSKSNASGGLSKSLQVNDPKENGSIISIDVLMAEHGLYINSGVKGTKSGKSNAGYSFKKNTVGTKMVNEIQKWIKRSGISTRNTNIKTKTGLDIKRKSVSELNKGRSVSYAVATNIKKFGIRPTGFLDIAVITTENKISNRFDNAFEIDILTSLPDKL